MTPKNEPADQIETSQDWLTVPAAAARFGVSERALRRAISRLENDPASNPALTRQVPRTTRTGPGLVTGFQTALLERLAGEIRASNDGNGQSETLPENEQETRQELGKNPVNNSADPAQLGAVEAKIATLLRESLARERETVARLEAENGRLWQALTTEQNNVAAVTGELAKANERAAYLLTAMGTGRLSLPPMDASNDEQEATRADLGAESGPAGESVGSGEIEGKRHFWAFWKDRRKT